MALSNGELSAADIAAVTGGNGGFGNGDSSWWLLILFLFAFGNGNWGNWGNNNGMGTPFVVNDVQSGFDQAAIMSGINGINSTLANAEVSRCNMLANLTGQLSNVALNQATAACNTNAQVADLKYTVANEACADRQAVTDALQVVTNTINSGIQSIKDQMNQQTIDAKNEEIANLRTQINLSNLAASQGQQTAQLMADNALQTSNLIQRLNPTPIPAYVVGNPNGCGCGYMSGCGYGA